MQPGDTVLNAAIVATLRVGEREIVAVTQRPITITTTAPVITSVHPAPEARLTNTRPNIVVRFFDAITGVNPAAVRMLVNGSDVSAHALVTATSASYSPDSPLPPGPVRVHVEITNQVQSTHPNEWTFTIVPPAELIKSVTINPTTALKAGDILTVVMTGVPGGEATLAIEGSQVSVPMRESQTPGVYLGSYTAQPQIRLIDGPVLVTLSKAGQRSTMSASIGVTILPGPPPAPTVRVAMENPGDKRGPKLLLTGRSVPGAHIEVVIAAPTTEKHDQGTLGQFSTVATVDGNWRSAIGPVIPLPGAKLLVNIVALDASGQRSPRTTLEITLP